MKTMKSAKEIAAGWLVDPEPDQLEALTNDVKTIQADAKADGYRAGLLRAAELCLSEPATPKQTTPAKIANAIMRAMAAKLDAEAGRIEK